MIYEDFSLYGIKLKYPERCIIHPSSQLKRLNGELSFIFDEKESKLKLTFSWKPLSHIKRRYRSNEEFSNAAIKLMKKDRSLEALDVLEHKIIEVNGHKTVFCHIKISLYKPLLFKPTRVTQEVKFAVIFCEESERCITLYSEEVLSESSLQNNCFEKILNSIICH
ncbi:hypothetical protein KEJ50_03955 [Candidatus Bathyarchaeota archaeon]|nr:hypothetical protein [Candidatus Bathyarchaeota archaeon]